MGQDQLSVPQAEGETQSAVLPTVDSRDLLGGQREVLIKHGTEVYRLRLPSNKKLILMK
jgi:hemin uptake protein HemP